MGESHSIEKSSSNFSFNGRIRGFASANRVSFITFCAALLVITGYATWAFYLGKPEHQAQAIIFLVFFVGFAALYVLDICRFYKPEHKPANAPASNAGHWINEGEDTLEYRRVISPYPMETAVQPASKEGPPIYAIGFLVTAFITFVGSWIYCIANYGFLLGVGLGWLPSIIVAVIAGALWPLIVIAIVALVVLIFK